MKHPVDIDNWNRRENYLFFRDFANPYYSVTSQVDVTEAYIRAKALGIKFSHYAMYASLRAVNSIEALRYRQVDGKVWLYDRIRLNSFTGLQFQFPQNAGENIPLSVFGKIMVDMQGRRTMPVAVSFHHGFVDGYQVGRYWEAFQHNLDTLSM